jgi:hypothetical protein
LAADTTPDAFQFQRSVNATRGAWTASASITIAGINTLAPITIADGEYAIAGGTFTSAAGTISAGQTLTVRGRASSGYSRNTRVRVTIGGVTSDFEVTSELPNYVPDAIAYDGQNVVYLLNSANRFVFRWSIPEAHYSIRTTWVRSHSLRRPWRSRPLNIVCISAMTREPFGKST